MADPKPIPMRLTCPECGELHIDEGEFATKVHHTHACQSCGNVWRPAVVPTVGVRFLPGFRNDDKPPPVTFSSSTVLSPGPWDLDAEHEPIVDPSRVKVARSSRKRRRRV